jgi:hypothetical protein
MLMLSALFLISWVSAVSADLDLCYDDCGQPVELTDVAADVPVIVTGCPGDRVNLTLIPPRKDDNRTNSLRITDLHMEAEEIEHVIYYTDEEETVKEK